MEIYYVFIPVTIQMMVLMLTLLFMQSFKSWCHSLQVQIRRWSLSQKCLALSSWSLGFRACRLKAAGFRNAQIEFVQIRRLSFGFVRECIHAFL